MRINLLQPPKKKKKKKKDKDDVMEYYPQSWLARDFKLNKLKFVVTKK